jgi:hypothetical protein
MKKAVFYIISIAIFGFAACNNQPQSVQVTYYPANEYVGELQKIASTFTTLSLVVDSMSADLSEIEKERAAFFLTSAYSLVMESYVEKGDPAEPALTVWMSPTRKFAGDNPYTIYTQAPVDSNFVYKLSGKMGNAMYFGIQVYGYANGFNLPSANLGLTNIVLNSDNTFEVYLSSVKPDNVVNWVKLANRDHAFLVRQYFDERNQVVPAELKIERVDNNSFPGLSYLKRLEKANAMLNDYILGTIDVCSILANNALNQYPSKDAQVRTPKYGGALYPTRDNRYEGCWVSLKEGEALHLHGFLPENTMYASYVFYDRWYNTPDYRKINCFRTKDEIVLNADGSFDLYVSPEKVNHPNWINTGGLYEGSYSSRYMMSEETRFPEISIVNIKNIK